MLGNSLLLLTFTLKHWQWILASSAVNWSSWVTNVLLSVSLHIKMLLSKLLSSAWRKKKDLLRQCREEQIADYISPPSPSPSPLSNRADRMYITTDIPGHEYNQHHHYYTHLFQTLEVAFKDIILLCSSVRCELLADKEVINLHPNFSLMAAASTLINESWKA